MPAELRWGEQAHEDLIDIYLTIATENESAAEKIVESIEVRVASLADYPRLGPLRNDIREGLRVLVERNYLILYEIDPDHESRSVERVDIVRILDGRRNLIELV